MTGKAPKPDLTLLFPLYNEEGCLRESVETALAYLEERGLRAEVLLGSNGSTDGTCAVGACLEAEYPGVVRFFHLEERGVVGEVFLRAMEMAASNRLVSMDVDLSVHLDFIPRALALLDDHAVVVGSKQSGTQNRSLLRRFGSGAFIFCAQVLLKLPYDDYSIGAKAYDVRRVTGHLDGLSPDTNYVLDILHNCHGACLPVAVLPILCVDWRTSRFNLGLEALVRFSHLFRVWLDGTWRSLLRR